MNIKKQIPRLISALLSFSIVLGNVIPAYATESITVEKPVNDESNWVTDEGNFEEIEVTYEQASTFFVTIPKTIILDGWKQSIYSVKVSGDIAAEQCVYVAPVDGIADTENIDFYMKDQASENKKEDVLATVTQKKMHWNSAEAAEMYEQTDNLVSAPDLTAGTWKGIFQMEIKLETHSSHTHNYIESITKNPTCTEDGERTYTCDCGDSYTETIPATGHHYVDGECEHCGEKDPDAHEHSYTETITKEPTCTEEGEKELSCTKCGYSYTEEVPSNGGPHIDENGDDVCDKCGHKHIWEDNVDTLEWIKNFNSSSIVKTGDQWKLYYDTSNQYTKYTLDGYWDITVPEDVEYSFDYRLSEWGSDSLAIYLDDTEIVNVSEDSTDSKIVTLTKGTHTIHAHFNKQSEWTGPYATITLNPIIVLNHVCTECGEKEAHHYAEGIVIKEPTCTEKGEKEFTCTKCGGTKTEEIDALGHNYVDGVCDRCGSLNLVKKRFWSAISSTSETEDTGGGHYDMATLSGTYSPNIEITEDMRDGEYLLLDFYVKYPFYGGQGHYGEADGIDGLSMLQKYNEETDTWETVYSYGLSYSTVGTNMAAQEGGYTFSPGNGIRRSFQLEKGTYRAYGRFSAGSGCGSSVAHHYYTYFISVDLCRVEKEAVETP